MNNQHAESLNALSVDSFYHGKVTLLQKKRGYRFSLDAPILADFLPSQKDDALEIGTGSGIVSILALYKKKFPRITGIEIQKDLQQLAVINAENNGFKGKLRVIHDDFNRIYKQYTRLSLIFSNPPFYKIGTGRLSPNREIRIARSEVSLTLNDIIEKTYGMLNSSGRLCLILPFARYTELLDLVQSSGFFITRLRHIYPFKNDRADRFLIQLSRKHYPLDELPPLIVFKKIGVYTEEMEEIFKGNGQ